MKKIKIFALIFVLIVLFSSISYAYAQALEWKIKSFNSSIIVRQDRSIEVTEEITADFKSAMHGIYRYIPIVYGKGSFGSNSLGLKLISITDESGKPYKYTTNYSGDFVYYKIGDKDITFTGKHVYLIKYVMKNIVRTYQMDNFAPGVNEYDELYFNVTSNNCPVNIDYAQAVITLPKGGDEKKMRIKAFTGGYGETGKNYTAKILKGQVFYFSAANLKPNEGLTVLAGWPTGIVNKEDKNAKTLLLLLQNWFFFMPVLVLIFLLFTWYKHGKDIKRTSSIVAQYEPPKKKNGQYFSPVDVGVIIDEKFDPRDLTAEMVNLAVKGHLKIKELESKTLFFFSNKDYELEELSKDKTALTSFEMELLKKLFKDSKNNKVKLSDLKNDFYSSYIDLKEDKYKELVKEGIFVADPEKVRGNYMGVGIAIMIFTIPLSIFLSFANIIFANSVFWAILCGVICGLEFILFAPLMPRKTQFGVEVFNYIYGFEDYIKTAEESRIKWEVSENLFEKYLPYAMVFRLEDKWAKRFEGVYKNAPDWYESSTPMTAFAMGNFIHSINETSSLMTNTFTATSRTTGTGSSGFSSGGGGGFSGGGGGGGGVGGW